MPSGRLGRARRETTIFVGSEWGVLPLLQRKDGGEGWGEEAVLFGRPLSLTLSPFVPHGERESTAGKNIWVVAYFSPKLGRAWPAFILVGRLRAWLKRFRLALTWRWKARRERRPVRQRPGIELCSQARRKPPRRERMNSSLPLTHYNCNRPRPARPRHPLRK